ncbi:MAG: MATE family efflux transporter [Lachnospiraceae bacterium]|nr:MATE family efflux transporter [Lachnospiraceae bacterium]
MKNERDEAFREESLNGNMWRLILRVGTPLAFFMMLNSLYGILDSLMAAHINSEAVSAVAYLTNINELINAAATALAVGGSIKIATAYGKGDDELVSREVSTVLAMAFGLGLLILCASPFSAGILKLAGTPAELIPISTAYFAITLATTAFMFFNTVYIAIERSRGNTKRIFILNTVSMLIKLGLSALFIYVWNKDVTFMAVASLVSQLFLFGFGLYNVTRKDTAFRFSFRRITMKAALLKPLSKISVPIFVEKSFYAAGKIIVSSMCSFYGVLAVGAMGTSNKVTGLFNSPETGIQDGSAALVSQNIGAGNYQRALEIVKRTFAVLFVYALIATAACLAVVGPASYLYALTGDGLNTEFRDMIRKVLIYEAAGTMIPWSFYAAALTFIYATGNTKQLMIINFIRLFVFRIGLFWLLQRYTSMDVSAAGLVMVVSNAGGSLLGCLFAAHDIRVYCREYGVSFFGKRRAS